MARKIDEIELQILNAIAVSPTLSTVLTSTSRVSVWRLLVYIFSVAVWALENLFDIHKAEVTDIIENTRPSYLPDLKNSILNFQYGYDLVPGQTFYDNTGIDESLIAASKVVKYVAIVELTRGLLIKVAGSTGGDLAPLTSPQAAALFQFVGRIKPPGVGIRIVNKVADSLKITQRIYYNPLILDNTGKRLDGSSDTPIQQATEAFLKSQPFNGQYIINRHERAIEAVDGVVIAPILNAEADYESVGFIPFDVLYLPDSGYLRFATPSDYILEFVPHENL